MRGSGSPGRALVAIIGGLLAFGGLAAIATGDPSAAATGIWLVVAGMVFIIAAALERWRYRSESADRASLPIGPGGGEPVGEPMDTRFQRTDEAFFDPTSGHRMRVWLDPASGERRYRAEG
jgi:hypothetical protein